jgi:hypothetical protein
MARKKRISPKGQSKPSRDEDRFIQAFEEEYTRIARGEGLAAAKAYFRENFMVQCFACGYMGKTVPPLNCARCGMYLD